MLPFAALLTGALVGAADLTAAVPTPDAFQPLHLHGVPLARSLPADTLRLREPEWSASARTRSVFDDVIAPAQRGAQTAPAAGAPAAPPADDAAADQPTAEEIQQTALLRQRRQIRDIHRPLGVTTWAAMAGTVFFGTIAAINQRTLFGDGLCSTTNSSGGSNGIFGDFGCSQMGNIHELSAFITVSLYTATGIYSLNMLRLDNAAGVSGHDSTALAVHKVMAYIHLAGMILQPILGIIAVNPGIVGVSYNPTDPTSLDRLQNFQAAMRTIHIGVGYVTFAALTTAMVLEYY